MVLLAAVVAGARISGAWAMATPWLWLAPAAALGAVLALGAAARMVVRVRLLARVQEGDLVGFHVVPRSGREDEVPLLPLVRSANLPTGVLAATGASAPYRGARGVLKLALAPLPGAPPRRPLASLLWAAIAPLGHAAVTLLVGAGAALVVGAPIFIFCAFRDWG